MDIVRLSEVEMSVAVARAGEVLSVGGIVIYPTDTIYGAAVDATNSQAVECLFSFKAQKERKPIAVAVKDLAMAGVYIEVSPQIEQLFATLLPGPYTVVGKSRQQTDARLETIHGTLGVRVIPHPFVQALFEHFPRPITTTSALPAYKKKPYAVDDLLTELSERQREMVRICIDAGEFPKAMPSTVIDTTVGEVQVLRQGSGRVVDRREYRSASVDQTIRLGSELLSQYQQYIGQRPIIFALTGEMGAGKTHFAKGMAEYLGVSEAITSPTYTIINEYNSERGVRLYHLDTWRLRDSDELEALGFLDLVQENNVFAVEWADKVVALLDKVHHDAIVLFIDIAYKSDEERLIRV